MAVIAPIINDGPEPFVTWGPITTADTGGPIDISKYQDITIHVVGSGTAQMQRSNDGTNYVSWGSALAANSINDQGVTSARNLKISAVATATVTVVLSARKKKP